MDDKKILSALDVNSIRKEYAQKLVLATINGLIDLINNKLKYIPPNDQQVYEMEAMFSNIPSYIEFYLDEVRKDLSREFEDSHWILSSFSHRAISSFQCFTLSFKAKPQIATVTHGPYR